MHTPDQVNERKDSQIPHDSAAEPSVRRRYGRIWIISTIALTLILGVILVVPGVFAQRQDRGDQLNELFRQVYEYVEQNFVEDVDPEVLIEGALRGMFEALDDPYSEYLDERSLQDLRDTSRGQFGGVGMIITKQTLSEVGENNPRYIKVVSPIEGTPASRAGVRPNDLILSVEGESTAEYSTEEVANQLRGEPGTDVDFLIRRASGVELPITVTRALIEVPTVRHAMINDTVAYLRITQFTPFTASRAQEAISEFDQAGYESLVVDLRSNPGGLLDSAVDVADLFLSGGLVVGTSGRGSGTSDTLRARPGAIVDQDIAIAILTDGGSASAAEILAGALKDRGRGSIVGETTFGKGSVQVARDLGLGEFKLTISRYYTPDGHFIHGQGIDPDFPVAPPELQEDESDDFSELVRSGRIPQFVDRNPDPSESEIQGFLETLEGEGYELREWFVRQLIHSEVLARSDEVLIFDLEFDPVLERAVELLETGRISTR